MKKPVFILFTLLTLGVFASSLAQPAREYVRAGDEQRTADTNGTWSLQALCMNQEVGNFAESMLSLMPVKEIQSRAECQKVGIIDRYFACNGCQGCYCEVALYECADGDSFTVTTCDCGESRVAVAMPAASFRLLSCL